VPKTWLFEPQKEAPLLLKGPPPTHLGNLDEQRAFDFFKQTTAPQFAGHHDKASKFWKGFIPQTATSDLLIFKLVVALGSRHEAVVYGTPKSSILAKRSHEAVIATLARSLSNLRVEISLLCCAMLTTYANLCEEVPATATMHLCLGLRILREVTKPGNRKLTDPMSDYIEPLFAELELATAFFGVPPADVEIICPDKLTPPAIPTSFGDLYEAKRSLNSIVRWQLYLTVLHRASPAELTTITAEIDALLGQWRRTVVKYSVEFLVTNPGLFNKARRMLFQFKLFGTCRAAANDPIFVEASRVQIISIDFSQPHIASMLCTQNRNGIKSSWRPLHPKPNRDQDDLDIWPEGEALDYEGPTRVIMISIGKRGSSP